MQTPGLFVTGTDTDVGKTWVTCLIASELHQGDHNVGVYKPACSGSVTDANGHTHWHDLTSLADSIEHRLGIDQICPQRFNAPLAPPVAAQLEDRSIEEELLLTGCAAVGDLSEFVLVEGVGGLLCPLTDSKTIADFASSIGYPLIIVARAGLGTINHTLLTVEVAQSRKLSVAGIILNETQPVTDESRHTNAREIGRHTEVPILGYVEFGATCLRSFSNDGMMDWLQFS